MNDNERPSNWYDQDRLWEATTEIMFGHEVWERAAEEVEQVLSLAALTPPIRVLDLPCGTGRHTLEFARLGCDVTGVDRTAHHLEQAEQRLAAADLNAQIIESDMRQFRQPESFDLAINLYTSFGYFEDVNDDLQVLQNFYISLRPGGVLVMDLVGKEVIARVYSPRDWHELDDGTLFLQERSIQKDWSWIENRWIIIHQGGRRDEFRLAHRLYGASDLRNALAQTGFTDIRIYGHLSGGEYDHMARRLVVVAHKPESA